MRTVSDARTPAAREDGGLEDMLKDFLSILDHLTPLCDDLSHVVEVVRGAVENDSQLSFLANVLKRSAKK